MANPKLFKLVSLRNNSVRLLRYEHEVREFIAEHIMSPEAARAVADNRSTIERAGFLMIGIVSALVFNPYGELVDAAANVNTITTLGKQATIDRLQGVTPAVHDYIAIGTGSTSPSVGDTTLETEVARGQGTLSQPTPTQDKCEYTFSAGTGTGTITEVGRFNAPTGGNLFGRSLFSPSIVKGASDALVATYIVSIP